MTEPHCPAPIAFDDAVDYWAGDLTPADEARIEDHVFGCDDCARQLAAAEALAAGVAAAVRDGRLHTVLTEGILNRLAADGVRIRMFTLDGPGIVPCAVWAGDDLIVSRIRADFSGVDGVSIITRQASGDEIGRLVDIPIRPGQREILNAFSAERLRALPATRVQVAVVGQRGGREQTLAEYTLEHGGSFDRLSG
jgi:hypothetical protein